MARVLLARPEVMLLDEATSALDNETEKAVQAGIDTHRGTRVIIAHRLSTIRDADQIIVLDEGRVIERGTHSELAGRGGAYASLLAAAERDSV